MYTANDERSYLKSTGGFLPVDQKGELLVGQPGYLTST